MQVAQQAQKETHYMKPEQSAESLRGFPFHLLHPPFELLTF